MKIIAVNTIYLTSSYYGSGFYTYVYELLNGLIQSSKEIKCEYWLYTPEASPILKQLVEAATKRQGGRQRGSKFKLIVVARSGKGQQHFANDIVKHVSITEALLEHRVKVLFLPHLELPQSKYVPKDLQVVPLIHDIIPSLFLMPRFLFRGKTPLSMLTRRGVKDYLVIKWGLFRKYFSHLLTISEASKESLGWVFGKKWLDRVSIAFPGQSSEFKILKNQKYFARSNLAGKGLVWKQYVVYFGGYTVRKNVERLILAFQEVESDVKLVLVGGAGKPRWERKVIKAARQSGKKFVLLPKLPIEDLNLLLSGAKFSIYPSLYEGFGLPLVESIQAGALPLASDIPSSREILPKGYPLFNPYSVKDIQEKLEYFLKVSTENLEEQWFPVLKQKLEKYNWLESAKKLDGWFADL